MRCVAHEGKERGQSRRQKSDPSDPSARAPECASPGDITGEGKYSSGAESAKLASALHRAVRGCRGRDLFRSDGGTGTRIGAFKSPMDLRVKGSSVLAA